MITLDTVRAALLVSDPYEGIDRLILAELAAGRMTKAIYDELLPLVKPLRAATELTEDAEEALFGALDGLTGYCHPDCAYKDPEPPGPPPSPASLPRAADPASAPDVRTTPPA